MLCLIWGIIKWTAILYSLLSLIRRLLQKYVYGDIDRRNEHKIQGKVVIVTGASSGTGQSAALEFAKRDATVILACRNISKAEETVHWIRGHTLLGELVVMKLDLANLASVREFAKEFKSKYEKLDILVNNAGIMYPLDDKVKTSDNFELNMGTNHLGHFLVTNLLLEPLKKAAPSRIVIVSSLAHSWNEFNVRDIMSKKEIVPPKSDPVVNYLYCRSKKANALFSRELAKRLNGSGVTTYCLCPGLVSSNLAQNQKNWYGTILNIIWPVMVFGLKTPEEGAATIIHCALNKNLDNETGDMYQHCNHWDPSKRAVLTDDDAKTLWEESVKCVGSLN